MSSFHSIRLAAILASSAPLAPDAFGGKGPAAAGAAAGAAVVGFCAAAGGGGAEGFVEVELAGFEGTAGADEPCGLSGSVKAK